MSPSGNPAQAANASATTREVGGSFDFDGDLLAAEAAVHVGADADVRVSTQGEVADMLEMVDDVVERGAALGLIGTKQKCVVKIDADDPVAGDDCTDHRIGELSFAGNDRPTIRMGGDHRPRRRFEQPAERLLGEVRCIVDHPQA